MGRRSPPLVHCFLLAASLSFWVSGSAAARSPAAAAPATLYELLTSRPDLRFALTLFNYTGLLPLARDPATQITCFLPSSQTNNETRTIEAWEGPDLFRGPQRGRYMWAILLHHCLQKQSALSYSQLKTRKYDSAVVNRGYYDNKLYGAPLSIRKRGSELTVIGDSGAYGGRTKFLARDLAAGKSMVHIIDNLLFPSFAPPDAWSSVSELLGWENGRTSNFSAIYSASSLVASLDNSTEPFTLLAPKDEGIATLLAQLNTSLATLLTKRPLCDLLVRAHVIPGRDLWTGAFISLPGPVQLRTAAGSALNATTDLPIVPGRKGPVRFITLATAYGSALLSDYDQGGNGNDGGDEPLAVPWVAHYTDGVLLPQTIRALKAML